MLTSSVMTLRRPLALYTLFAMMHFIIVGTAAACSASAGDAPAASAAHAECAPPSTHTKEGTTDRPAEVPCCAALASCATAPLVVHSTSVDGRAPNVVVASALAERPPRAEIAAPELPPPRA